MDNTKSSFQQVAEMNEAFGNPKGSYDSLDIVRLRNQVLNVLDEVGEFFIATGLDSMQIGAAISSAKAAIKGANQVTEIADRIGMRDALCDIPVFALGAQHLMGVNGDHDMRAVVAGVMTRFIKDAEDLNATIALHAAKGVTKVYFEGEFPKMIMKSAEDQPDAPKGKFLKSASYQDTVFPAVVVPLPQDVSETPVTVIYMNSNHKAYHYEDWVEGQSYLTGSLGDYIIHTMNSGRKVIVAMWSDNMAAWQPCPATEVQ